MPKCLFLNTFYSGFLNQVYSDADLCNAGYDQQMQALNTPLFGDSDFYSRHLAACGFETQDIVVNCQQVQAQWALENGLKDVNLFDVLVAQVEEFQPDVLYVQDLNAFEQTHMQTLKSVANTGHRVVGQIASPLPGHAPLELYDLIVTSFPHFTERLNEQGIRSRYQPLAFEPRVLERISTDSRDVPISFVGGISSLHSAGTKALTHIAEKRKLDVWGYGAETLPNRHVLRRHHHGPVYGIEMFEVFGHSKLTLNRHIDVAENYANNMRMYEATGCGALLITDYRDNLQDLFDIGKEVVVYRSVEEADALIAYYLDHPDEAEDIAQAGQARTLAEHTYEKRMRQSAEWLNELA